MLISSFFVLLLLGGLKLVVDAACPVNTGILLYSYVETKVNGVTYLRTNIDVHSKTTQSWCVELGDNVQDNGVSYTFDNSTSGSLLIAFGDLIAEHRSALDYWMVVNIPSADDVFKCHENSICVKTEERCRSNNNPEWWSSEDTTDKLIVQRKYYGHGCACNAFGRNCDGDAYTQFNQVEISKNTIIQMHEMSNQYGLSYNVNITGTGAFSNYSSFVVNSKGVSSVRLGQGEGAVAMDFTLYDNGISAYLPANGALFSDLGEFGDGTVMAAPEIMKSGVECGDTLTSGWWRAGTLDNIKVCLAKNMESLGWMHKEGNAPITGHSYSPSGITDFKKIGTKYSSIVNSNVVHVENHAILLRHTLTPQILNLRFSLPPRKVIATQSIGYCVLDVCFAEIIISSEQLWLTCNCTQTIPGEVRLNATGSFFQTFAVQLQDKQSKFRILIATAENDHIIVCAQNCINATVVRVRELSSYDIVSGDPGNDKGKQAQSETGGTSFGFVNFLKDALSFQSLLSLINCIKDMNTGCIVGSLFGTILNLVFIILFIWAMFKLFQCLKAKKKPAIHVKQIQKDDNNVELTGLSKE